MAVYLSPGVYSREIDLSLYVPNLSTTSVGMVGCAEKGPINDPTYITNPVQFGQTFGRPKFDYYGPYSALQYLHTGRQLWYVRVSELDPDDPDGSLTGSKYLAKYATTTLYEEATPATLTGSVNTLINVTTSNNVLQFFIDESSNASSAATFSYTFADATASGVTKSVSEIISTLNADSTFKAYLQAYLTTSGTLGMRRATNGTLVRGANHSVRVRGNAAASMIGATANGTLYSGTGFVDEQAYILGSGAPASVTIVLGSNDDLSIWSGDNTAAPTETVYVVPAGTYATKEEVAAALNGISGFSTHFVATVFGSQIKVAVKSSSSKKHVALGVGTNDAGLDIFGYTGRQATLTSGVTFGTGTEITIVANVNDTLEFTLDEWVGAVNTLSTVSITIPAGVYTATTLAAALDAITDFSDELDASAAANRLSIALAGGSTKEGFYLSGGTASFIVFGYQPYQLRNEAEADETLVVTATSQGTWGNRLGIKIVSNTDGSFDLTVLEDGIVVESYKKLVKTPLLIPDPLNPTSNIANPNYVETAINNVSSRITVTNPEINSVLSTKNPIGTGTNPATLLTGGTDGNNPVGTSDPSLYIGINDGTTTTGLQFFSNPEQLDINLLLVPGVTDAAVINEMILICQTRDDCMAIVDPPFGLLPQDMVDWVNGAGDYADDHQAFNSSYAAVYWPWLQIYDNVNKEKVYTPPSGLLANVYAYSDYVADPWIAPAGLNRGRLVTPLRAEYNPTLGERDLLYLNNVNPIATFIRDGINVWGQKTLQRKPSALDRVNVRRLLLYLKKVIATASRYVLFEPNDPLTWTLLKNLIEPFLQSVKDRRGLVEFQVRCDETTNTADVIERNEAHCFIFLKPTKTLEFLELSFVLTSQGVSFSEITF